MVNEKAMTRIVETFLRCSTRLSYKSFDLVGFEPTTHGVTGYVVPTAFIAKFMIKVTVFVKMIVTKFVTFGVFLTRIHLL